MEIEAALKWIDGQVFAKTGKHLDSLQRVILEGTLHNQKYPDIAANSKFTNDHVKKAGWKLWKLLSEVSGENVNQSNFRSFLQREGVFNNVSNNNIVNSKINVCSDKYHHPDLTENRSPSTSTNNSNNTQLENYDLTYAPEFEGLVDRTLEISTLKQWILQSNAHLVTLLGLSGIGKTALAVQLVPEIKDNFDYIIWRNLSNFPTWEMLETNLIEFFSQRQETKLTSAIDYLRSARCLLILDNLQQIIIPGELTGYYLPISENYSKLFQEIAESKHNSCLLLMSWEKPRQIATLEAKNRYCRTLQIKGLGESAQSIFTDKELTDKDRWLELIELYGGNPLWLNIIATTIQELFAGSVADCLSYPHLFLGDLEFVLALHYQRLSELEKLVISWFASQDEAVKLTGKPTDVSCSEADFLKALQSLIRRCLIEKIGEIEQSLFMIQPVIKEYVKNQPIV